MVIFTCPVWDDDQPDVYATGRRIRPPHLVLCDERICVVFLNTTLDAAIGWRTHHQIDTKLVERLNQPHAIEFTVTVDVPERDVFTCGRDELADGSRQLVGTTVFENDTIEREPNVWIDDTDGGELVGEIRSLIRVRVCDFRCLSVTVEQPVVDVDCYVNGLLEDASSRGMREDLFADGIELVVDAVRIKSTEVVQKGSRKRVSCGCFDSNVVTTSSLVGFRTSIRKLVVESDPREDFDPVLSREGCIRRDTDLNLRKQQRGRC